MSLLLLHLLLLSTTTTTSSPSPPIGVVYNPLPHPPKTHIVSSLRASTFTRVRLLDPSPSDIRAFSYSNLRLLLSLPNSYLPSFSASPSSSLRWASSHLLPFHPRSSISAVSLGHHSSSPSLLPALTNLRSSLLRLGLLHISVTTVVSFDSISPLFPPSAARFNSSVAPELIEFLSKTNSSFLIDVQPFHVYRTQPSTPIGFAVFADHPFGFRTDPFTGLRYRNLYDVMVDAAVSAVETEMKKGGRLPVVVSATGWPSRGGEEEPAEAGEVYAEMYLKGLVRHLESGVGTPMRREGAEEVYVFELFDNWARRGLESGRHWGVWFENLTGKYEGVDFSGAGRGAGGGGGCGWSVRVGVWVVVLVFLV
ncbi:Glucan endo-1,3-beta-glucosidase 13 [Acorus calamus]|uniref:Glucan endo-1,3-beta-glucosidase 13 n=1 Tax=Acorus calamus TaxID=4465 RepID=A0AAV9DC53_ACOCL|nr:Glucan endo-1,3-beta-glucosidase 13 [Acorus calamus]